MLDKRGTSLTGALSPSCTSLLRYGSSAYISVELCHSERGTLGTITACMFNLDLPAERSAKQDAFQARTLDPFEKTGHIFVPSAAA